MKLSGFTFVRNATKLDFPLRESIQSILPIVDEFVIAYCEGDEDDHTLELIESFDSEKIKVIQATWEPQKFYKNTNYAYLTDLAKEQCSGDWLFYLQADEVIHEKYHETIVAACNHYLNDPKIDGFLFNYNHFWGDYNHCFRRHGWYPYEIRIVRNNNEIHSWRDAQSFRKYSEFKPTAEYYLTKEHTSKLRVVLLPVFVYHYGWVRNPVKMQIKHVRMKDTFDPNHKKITEVATDYGPLSKVPTFNGTHPEVMQQRIGKMDWQESLQMTGKKEPSKPLNKHEKLKYRLRTWLELNVLGGRQIGGFINYKLVGKYRPK